MGLIVINTYAGSLLAGAERAGIPVDVSLEDCGYGQKFARLNFPDLDHRATPATWPDEKNRDAVVIAHPPCAAFSIAGSRNKEKQGLDSPHFEETKLVINYALGALEAKALAVESVPRAYTGAAEVHEALAEEHGYHLFRILQNAATFGLPQWRPRFWAVFLRKDVADQFAIWHDAECVTLGQVLSDEGDGEPDAELDRRLEVQKEYLRAVDFSDETIAELFNTPGFMGASIAKLLPAFAESRGIENDIQAINKEIAIGGHESGNPLKITKAGYAYRTKTIRVLDPEGTSGVVFGGAWWMYKGRNVTPLEYRRIMGFPDEYKLDGWYKQWLSKGVCPPVAQWIINLLVANTGEGPPLQEGVKFLQPGETADFNITRAVHAAVAKGDIPASQAYTAVVPKSGTTAPRTRTVGKAPRKRRVIRSYYFICPDEIPEDLVRLAFEPKKADLVVHPLHSVEERDDGFKAVIQYEPPNIGGHRGDVERIAKRVVKKLADAGYTVEFTDEGPWFPPKEDA